MGRKKKSKEELQQEQLEKELNEIKEELYFIPEPTYTFNIGDRVSIGLLKDVTIEEISENGKIYKIDYSYINNNYGNPIKYEHEKRYATWLDIRKYKENRSNALIKNDDLRLNFSQRTMEDIITKAYCFGIDFNPDYQRDYVWELENKIALIESIFNNVDIGKFVFIKNDYGNKYAYEILDGKQRIRAILDFYEDRFKYKGLYFSDLSNKEQYFFKDYMIAEAELANITEKQKLQYFLKLNISGKIMAKEQLDKVKDMLKNINDKENE